MNQKQGLTQELGLRTGLSQQQLRYVRLLEMTTPELEEAVQRELIDNPALEADEPNNNPSSSPDIKSGNEASTRTYYTPSDPNAEDYSFAPADNSANLLDYLIDQIDQLPLPDDVAEMAHYLAGMVDSNGYIRRPLTNIVNDLAFNQGVEVAMPVAEQALDVIKSLDPPGVGAFDLQESMRLQLLRLPVSESRKIALDIINDFFSEFSMKHYHRIQSRMNISAKDVNDAIALILTLNPKPGASFSSAHEEGGNIIIPDFIVKNRDGNLSISLNSHLPELAIEDSFAQAVDTLNKNASNRKNRKGNEFVISRYNDARDFIKILSQRQKTMMDVMTAIVKIQRDYFLSEDVAQMKPMMIKDIAAITGLDISTISRATNNKFVATDWGIFPLRHFFSDTIGGEGDKEGITNRQIEAEIKALVDKEDKKHPLSDEKLCTALIDKGYDVSRRTVAKYRDRLRIPVARLRKSI